MTRRGSLVCLMVLTPSPPSLAGHLCQPTSPTHSVAAHAVTRLSPHLGYYSVVRLLAAHPFTLRLSAYRVRFPDAAQFGALMQHRAMDVAGTVRGHCEAAVVVVDEHDQSAARLPILEPSMP